MGHGFDIMAGYTPGPDLNAGLSPADHEAILADIRGGYGNGSLVGVDIVTVVDQDGVVQLGHCAPDASRLFDEHDASTRGNTL